MDALLWARLGLLFVALAATTGCQKTYAEAVCEGSTSGGGVDPETRRLTLVFDPSLPAVTRRAAVDAAASWYPAIRGITVKEAAPDALFAGGLYLTHCQSSEASRALSDVTDTYGSISAAAVRGSGIDVISEAALADYDAAFFVLAHELGHHLGLANGSTDQDPLEYHSHDASDAMYFYIAGNRPRGHEIDDALGREPW